MNINKLTKENRTYFTRYYKLITIAVAITTAVITGSLVIGDSVRSTLVNRVRDRLGNTETVVFSMLSFMDSAFVHHPVFEGHTRALLVTDGFVSHAGRLIPVMVWGVNDLSVSRGKARINAGLAKELDHSAGDIVLRLPATGLAPSGSLFVTDNYTTGMRLSFDGIVDVKQHGNLSLKNEQTLPLNIFVNRDELAEALETEGKINLLLSERVITADDLDKVWTPAISGINTVMKDGFMEITSDRIFIPDEMVQAIYHQMPQTNRLFSYLVNSIEFEVPGSNSPFEGGGGMSTVQNSGFTDHTISYSFVTAMDHYRDYEMNPDEIILSDYAAIRLGVRANDTLLLTFYTSQKLKTLSTDTIQLYVSQIVPIQELAADTGLSADFPGLSNAERCTNWNADLPIDMTLITAEDEIYWETWKSTPKAIISYQAVAGKWSNSYGSATALRIETPHAGGEMDNSPNNFEPETLNFELSTSPSPLQRRNLNVEYPFFLQLSHPRATAFQAARNGVDFSSLFLSLGFFIILSAILLMLAPLSEMLFQRKDETTLMNALGYTDKRLIKLYRSESTPVVFRASVAGGVAGLIYTWFVLFLLGTVWKGATHTEGFTVYPHTGTILIGLSTGIVLSACLLWMALARSLKSTVRPDKRKRHSPRRKIIVAVPVTLLVVLTVFVNAAFIHSVVLFVLVGISFLCAAALWGDYLICRDGALLNQPFTANRLIRATLFAGRKQAMLSFFSLATGVFIVFSVGLNRQGFADSAQIATGTGGYSLWCESVVPVYHNLSVSLGREKLALTGLPADAEILQIFRYGADDASCLNLNKVNTPTVLGVDMEQLNRSRFMIDRMIGVDVQEADGRCDPLVRKQGGAREDAKNGENRFETFRHRTDSVYLALVDETVLTWGLGLQLGDTVVYESSKGKSVVLRLAGTLRNSIFQGNILIDSDLFTEIWDEITGSQVMLVKVDATETENVKMLISQALSSYGVSVMTTNDRLKMFNSVTDTYLTIFLMLGSIGLLLGIMSFVIVIRKNLASRRQEIHVYRSLGFPERMIAKLLYIENSIVPLYAIGAGFVGALLAAGGGIAHVSGWLLLISFFFAMLFVGCILLFIKRITTI